MSKEEKKRKLLKQMEEASFANVVQPKLNIPKVHFSSLNEAITAEEEREMQAIFSLVDSNKSGSLEPPELAALLRIVGVQDPTENRVQSVIKEVDSNNSGKIEWNEFVTALKLPSIAAYSKIQIKNAFQTIQSQLGTQRIHDSLHLIENQALLQAFQFYGSDTSRMTEEQATHACTLLGRPPSPPTTSSQSQEAHNPAMSAHSTAHLSDNNHPAALLDYSKLLGTIVKE